VGKAEPRLRERGQGTTVGGMDVAALTAENMASRQESAELLGEAFAAVRGPLECLQRAGQGRPVHRDGPPFRD
jgi:hypothetical protein